MLSCKYRVIQKSGNLNTRKLSNFLNAEFLEIGVSQIDLKKITTFTIGCILYFNFPLMK